MATVAGYLLSAIGTKLGTALGVTYVVRYGAPDDSGVYTENANVCTARYTYEDSAIQGNQIGSPEVVTPRIMVSVRRPFTGDSTALAVHQSLLDLASDVRLAVADLVMDHCDGTAPITGLGSLWILGSSTTLANLDIGSGASSESVTIEFQFRTTRNYGER